MTARIYQTTVCDTNVNERARSTRREIIEVRNDIESEAQNQSHEDQAQADDEDPEKSTSAAAFHQAASTTSIADLFRATVVRSLDAAQSEQPDEPAQQA